MLGHFLPRLHLLSLPQTGPASVSPPRSWARGRHRPLSFPVPLQPLLHMPTAHTTVGESQPLSLCPRCEPLDGPRVPRTPPPPCSTLNCSSDTTSSWWLPCMSGLFDRSCATSRGSGRGTLCPSSTRMPTTGARCISWIDLLDYGRKQAGDGLAGGRRARPVPPSCPSQGRQHPPLSPCSALTLLRPHGLIHSPLGRGHTQGKGIDGTAVGAGPQRGAVAGACPEAKVYM